MANRTYEVMYIVDPETPTEKLTKLNEAVGKLIEKEGGTVVRMDDGGNALLLIRSRRRPRATTFFLRSRVAVRRSRSSNAVCALTI